MIITPDITDDTPTYIQNFLHQIIEDNTMAIDSYSIRNWEFITTGPANPQQNSIIIRNTLIANDMYFVCGEITYAWEYPGSTAPLFIKDGFMACCRLDNINTLAAWHIYLSRGIQDIYNTDPTIPVTNAEIPLCDISEKGGNYGMDFEIPSDGSATMTYTDDTGATQTGQGIMLHTVGGVTITPAAGTDIGVALPNGGQVEYPLHHMWFAFPVDNVADGTVITDFINSALSTRFGISGNYNVTNYEVWGGMYVVGVCQNTWTGKAAVGAVVYRGQSTIPFLFGTDVPFTCWENYGGVGTLLPYYDNGVSLGVPDAGGGAVAFLYDITITPQQRILLDSNFGPFYGSLGTWITVGSAYAYENNINVVAATSPMMEIGVSNISANFGQSRNYSKALLHSPIIRQETTTAAQTSSADSLDNAYFSHVQQLSENQEADEMIMLRLQVPNFEVSGESWEGYDHISYYYTNPNLLNTDLGEMGLFLADVVTQIGPLISCNTRDHTWQTVSSEERGFQVINLKNELPIIGNKLARPQSNDLSIPIVDRNWTKTNNNYPRYQQDIRGFCGSYSPTNIDAPDFEEVRPYMLLYDSANSATIIPNYLLAVVGDWEVQVTSQCFFEMGQACQSYLTSQSVASLYESGGIMDMSYDVDRNQWIMTLSANQDGITFDNPALFLTATSNLQRFSFFKVNGLLNGVIASYNATTGGGVAQSTSYVYCDTAGGTDQLTAYYVGGNLTTSADGVGGSIGEVSGAIQLTDITGVSGRSVIMWVDYILFDGIDSMVAQQVQDLGLRVTIENVEWYKRKLLNDDKLNITAEEIENWAKLQQEEYRDMLIEKERQGRLRRRRRQQSAIAHDLEEQIQGQFQDTTVFDFLEDDFIEKNIKDISAFPDQDEALKHQVITDEQWTEIDSLYGTPIPKKETLTEKSLKRRKEPKIDQNKDENEAGKT